MKKRWQAVILRKLNQIKYLYRSIGPKGIILRVAQKIMAPIYYRGISYIALETIRNEIPDGKWKDIRGIECLIIEKVDGLKTWEDQLSYLVSVSKLKKQMKNNPGMFVILAIRLDDNNSQKKIVGYRKCQAGVLYTHKVKEKVSSDILFIIHTEVLAEYRGQGINSMLWKTSYEYCQRRGLKKAYGFIAVHNRSSVVSHGRLGLIENLTIFEVVSYFGGLYKRTTPLDEIRKAINSN